MTSPLPQATSWDLAWDIAPAVAAYFVLVGAVCYRLYRAYPQVLREVEKRSISVQLSSCLQLSSAQLQELYYKWLDQVYPALQLQPWAVVASSIGFHARMGVALQECGWLHQVAILPATILAVAGGLQKQGAAGKQYQSKIFLCRAIYMMAINGLMILTNDSCVMLIGTGFTSAPWMGLYIAILLTSLLVLTPCTIKDLDALCCILGAGLPVCMYLQYLQLTDRMHSFGTLFDADGRQALVAITFGASIACGGYYMARYRFASIWMRKFLQSIPTKPGAVHNSAGIMRILRLAKDGPAYNKSHDCGPVGFFTWASVALAAAALALCDIRYGIAAFSAIGAVLYRCRWLGPQVAYHAGFLIAVSPRLVLTTRRLQEFYCRWLERRHPALVWNSLVVMYAMLALHMLLVQMEPEGCGILHQLAALPATMLAAVCMGMEARGAHKQDQSVMHLCRAAYLAMAHLALMAWNDRCVLSMGPTGTSGLITGLYAAAVAASVLCLTPCTTKHLDALCFLVGTLVTASLSIQHLQLTGSLQAEHDVGVDGQQAVAAIACGAIITCAAFYAVRFRIASSWMMDFIDSLRHND